MRKYFSLFVFIEYCLSPDRYVVTEPATSATGLHLEAGHEHMSEYDRTQFRPPKRPLVARPINMIRLMQNPLFPL